jgi:LCP family protein required for cell wall assembly
MTVARWRSPLGAASLSLLFPGLGEWVVGDRRRAMFVATPALVVLTGGIGFAIGTVMGGGLIALPELLLRPEVLVAIVVIDLVALAYHLAAIADAWLVAHRTAGPRRQRGTGVAAVGVAVILALATLLHGTIAALGLETEAALTAIFPDDPGNAWTIPEASFEPVDSPTPAPSSTATPGATGSPAPTPSPTPTPVPVPAWAKDGRLNLLLVGSDAGTGRWLMRTDTMVVLSVDVESGRAALFGVPRNIVNVPLPKESRGAFADGRFPGMLNALYVYAWGHPDSFPGGDARGFRAVTGAIQELVGVKLDAFVAVDLRGFVKLVDAVDGLWIRVPKALVDERYPKVDGSGYTRISIKAGCQRLSGGMALAYARSRHQDSDYGRMARQQAVLLALRRQLDPVDLLAKAPEMLKIAKDHLWTTVKRADLPDLAELATRVDAGSVETVLFVPPKYGEFLTSAEIKRIRTAVRTVFDDPPEKGSGSGSGGSGKACP